MPSSNNSLLPDAAVQAIQDSVKTELIQVDNLAYATRPIFHPPANHLATTLRLNTLAGLVDYLAADIDGHRGTEHQHDIAIQVVSEEQVDLVGHLFGRYGQRSIFVTVGLAALFSSQSFQFSRYYDLEEFNVKLRTLFALTDETAELLRLLGNIREERVRTTEDDGISQTVIARVGIASVAEVRVPSPVTLRPFRTFREIEQPASPFIIRLRAGDEDELPTVALFEADGGAWKLTAIEDIKGFFQERDVEVPIFA